MPVWRNWQTRGTQNPVSSRTCRFDPDHRYQKTLIRRRSNEYYSFRASSFLSSFYTERAYKSHTYFRRSPLKPIQRGTLLFTFIYQFLTLKSTPNIEVLFYQNRINHRHIQLNFHLSISLNKIRLDHHLHIH